MPAPGAPSRCPPKSGSSRHESPPLWRGPCPDAEFEELLARAAEEGAKRALADVGLDGSEAALDIRDLRSLLASNRFVRRTAVQTTVHIITTGVILALLAGIALKLRIFGPGG